MPDKIRKGTKVVFAADRLGLIPTLMAAHTVEETVGIGDEGIYEQPHSALRDEDWHVIKVIRQAEDGELWLYCPCHRSQFEVV